MLLAGCAMAAGMLGCQKTRPPSTARINNTPLIIDDAMQKRDWQRSTSYYANGDTTADGTGYMFETHETIPDDYRRVIEPLVTTMNMALLPVGVFLNSPFVQQTYKGVIMPPTYTAQPPLK